jgi:hypothetical protein
MSVPLSVVKRTLQSTSPTQPSGNEILSIKNYTHSLSHDNTDTGAIMMDEYNISNSNIHSSATNSSTRRIKIQPITNIAHFYECIITGLLPIIAAQPTTTINDILHIAISAVYSVRLLQCNSSCNIQHAIQYFDMVRRRASEEKHFNLSKPSYELRSQITSIARERQQQSHVPAQSYISTQLYVPALSSSATSNSTNAIPNSTSLPVSEQICFQFNSLKPHSSTCQRKHICEICSKSHPAASTPSCSEQYKTIVQERERIRRLRLKATRELNTAINSSTGSTA